MTPTRPVATRQEILFQSLRSLMIGSRHHLWKSSLRINHARSLVWCRSLSVFGEVQPKVAISIIYLVKIEYTLMTNGDVKVITITNTVIPSTPFQHNPNLSSMENFSAE
jgi:hypothetical protein